MCLFWIPDDLEHAVFDNPLYNATCGLGGIIANSGFPYDLVELFDTLDALLEEL